MMPKCTDISSLCSFVAGCTVLVGYVIHIALVVGWVYMNPIVFFV